MNESDNTNVTVPVPSGRVADFYRWFADWVDSEATVNAHELNSRSASDAAVGDQEVAAAIRWWRLLKPREAQLFGLWIDAAPRMITATHIVDAMDLDGPRGIPGVLSWPKRKGEKAGFIVDWSFRYDPVTEDPIYGIEDIKYAQLLNDARIAVNGS